jgi:hypothetical protein
MHIDERLNWREGERERDKNRCISMKRLNWRERESRMAEEQYLEI